MGRSRFLKGVRLVTLLALVFFLLLTQNFSYAYNESVSAEIIAAGLSPDLEAYVGDSFKSLENSFTGSCIDNVSAVRLAGSSTATATYQFIETNQQLKDFYHKSLSMEGNSSLFGVSADASFEKLIEEQTDINNSKIALVIMYKYEKGQIALNSGSFNPIAADLISNGQINTFEALYGNSFSKRAYYGGMLLLSYIVEITNSSKVTKEEVRSALNVKYKTFLGLNVKK